MLSTVRKLSQKEKKLKSVSPSEKVGYLWIALRGI